MSVRNLIEKSIEELNEQLDDDKQLVYSNEIRLLGENAYIDSFITILEERISDELDLNIKIVSDKAFSRERSPFLTFESLEEFVTELIGEDAS